MLWRKQMALLLPAAPPGVDGQYRLNAQQPVSAAQHAGPAKVRAPSQAARRRLGNDNGGNQPLINRPAPGFLSRRRTPLGRCPPARRTN